MQNKIKKIKIKKHSRPLHILYWLAHHQWMMLLDDAGVLFNFF